VTVGGFQSAITPLTFTAHYENESANTCPIAATWTFGDGSPTVTSTAPVTFTYPHAGLYYGHYDTAIGQKWFGVLISFGDYHVTWSIPDIVEGQGTIAIVTRTGNLSLPSSVDYYTARALVPTSGALNFAAGEASKSINVQGSDDAIWNGRTMSSSGMFSVSTDITPYLCPVCHEWHVCNRLIVFS